jgi:hypothetical protein
MTNAFKLSTPITAFGKEVTELEIKEPSGGTIRRCGYGIAIDAAIRRGRRIECKRWVAIMKSGEAIGRFSMARELASSTDFSSRKVIDFLSRSPIDRRGRLAERMDGVIPKSLGLPVGHAGSGAYAAAMSWAAAMAPFAQSEER